jgi:subtilisin family serine protease
VRGRLGRAATLLATACALAVVAAPSGAVAKKPTRLEQAPRIALASPKLPRLSSGLAREHRTRSAVAVEIEARDVERARAAVRAAGGRVGASFGRLLEARVPASGLGELGASTAIRFAREPLRPELDSIGGQGVSVTAASAWHAAGYTGRGVKVAVIDGGFGGLARRQGEGELPRSLKRVDLCSSGGYDGPMAVEHGTAVAEIVYEMAPGAELHLICADTLVGLAKAAAYARAHGISVINHSVSWFNTSRGDGSGGPATPDAIVAEARAAGILWVNSAGNRGQQHWNGTFTDADGDGWHEFAPGDEGNTVTFGRYEGACIRLKWDEWPVSAEDYDLHLVRADAATSATDPGGGRIVASSRNAQTGSQPPTEQLCFSNPGERQSYAIELVRVSGTGSPRLDLFISPGPDFEHQVAEGSITEPASSPAAMAVGAVCWLGDTFESYSSRGPTIDGRAKPDLVAPANVSSATYGGFKACGGSGFAGTSASSPHVAGAAALVKQANPTFGPAELQGFLESRALDLGVPGRDELFGVGKLLLGEAPAALPRRPVAVRCVVPKLRGKTVSQARRALARAYCSLGQVQGVGKGRITKQSPRAGKRVATGTRVRVTVGRVRR